jgi:hypothetical protein
VKRVLETILIVLIFSLIAWGVTLNILQQQAVDLSKIPEKVEESRGFQRWITNAKNKGLDMVGADGFKLVEENEIYNTKWMKVYSADDEREKEKYEKTLAELEQGKYVIFSPSERIILDIRAEEREGYKPNEARVYGQLDDKIIDSRIMECSLDYNCYLDRGFFLENDFFVISEFSRSVSKDAVDVKTCRKDEVCLYSFKLHVVDLKHNKRWIYESVAFEEIWNEITPEL